MSPLLFALIQATATPASPAATEPVEGQTIVVTGKRLSVTERELAECIARKCPPKEEIDAALSHAENQFVAGDYAQSRRTLLSARSRNARYARDIPVDVADLLRANGRLAALNGLSDSSRINAIDTYTVLRKGLPVDDPRVLMQRLLVGDAFFKDKRLEAAREIFGEVARRARATRQASVEGHALFRTAIVDVALASVDPGFVTRADRSIRAIETTTGPELAPFREAAQDLRVQLQARGKVPVRPANTAVADADRADRAVIVYAPPIDVQYNQQAKSTVVVVQGDSSPQWADIAFRIVPDGSVADVETLRTSKNADGAWLAAAKASVAKRIYRPLAAELGSEGMQRVERFSFLYDVTAIKGSHIRSRAPNPRIEVTDLTVDPRES